LFEAVAGTAGAIHTKSEGFPHALSLGPLPALAEMAGTDGLLFVWASDYVSTAGRKVLTVLTAGPLGAAVPPGSPTFFVALVDSRTGDLLWFSRPTLTNALDLRSVGSAERVVRLAFEDLSASLGR